ncbi:MAG TPA: outer membrane beta-barrel protein [Kiritimatiellia bacterium]|nr:outer membrane beta-barrel protein [Kiritimatiellia bacterium]
MKKILALFTMTMVLAQGNLAAGGGFGVFGSYWDPKDLDDSLAGGGIKLWFNTSEQLAFEFRVSGLFNEEKDGDEKSTFYVVPLEVGLVLSLMPGEPVNVYLGGGVGYYIYSIEDEGPGFSETADVDNEFGFYGVGGVDFALGSSVRLFVEAKYTKAEIKRVEGMSVDASLDGIGVNAGLLFTW